MSALAPRGRAHDPVAFIDERLGAGRGLRFLMRYVFPDHWSFLLGEIALYAFVVLIASGTFLALFFDPSTSEIAYHGSYAALHGQTVSSAYASTLHISFDVSGGLLARQVHHWAALVFVAAITMHLLRIVFTGAFRKPRDVNYFIGVTLLALAILEGFAGYSLPDDLLSGMGLAIAWAVAMSLPLIGGPFATALWGGRFPGADAFESRLYIAHVFLIPALLAALITVHLAIIMLQRHSQFRGPGRRENNVVGTPMWPGYALRSLGLFAAVAAVLVLMGGLIQINPVWLWGPYHVYVGTNGAQPDWYLGWLIGALRLMPNLEIHVFGHTIVPNPFFGGVLFPGLVFALLYALPWLDRRFISKDYRRHDLLERPRDNPRRTALAAAVFSAVAVVFAAGSVDRLFFQFGFGYEGAIWFFRGAFFAVPAIVFLITRRLCVELAREHAHPLRSWRGQVLVRNARGGFEPLGEEPSAPASDV
ncbi:MAG TPA: cytochrome b [Solirubrobacteraceae bacterium]|nr:cytochrome b [Solirubrobacteraceae bacterium]